MLPPRRFVLPGGAAVPRVGRARWGKFNRARLPSLSRECFRSIRLSLLAVLLGYLVRVHTISETSCCSLSFLFKSSSNNTPQCPKEVSFIFSLEIVSEYNVDGTMRCVRPTFASFSSRRRPYSRTRFLDDLRPQGFSRVMLQCAFFRTWWFRRSQVPYFPRFARWCRHQLRRQHRYVYHLYILFLFTAMLFVSVDRHLTLFPLSYHLGAKNLFVIAVHGIRGRLNRLPAAASGDMIVATVKKGKPELRKKGKVYFFFSSCLCAFHNLILCVI